MHYYLLLFLQFSCLFLLFLFLFVVLSFYFFIYSFLFSSIFIFLYFRFLFLSLRLLFVFFLLILLSIPSSFSRLLSLLSCLTWHPPVTSQNLTDLAVGFTLSKVALVTKYLPANRILISRQKRRRKNDKQWRWLICVDKAKLKEICCRFMRALNQ